MAFQSGAFQCNAFQIPRVKLPDSGGSGGWGRAESWDMGKLLRDDIDIIKIIGLFIDRTMSNHD